MRALELLAPAKNLEYGKAAIDHGADAVYIGASRFGARVAAGNSLEDIAELCRYAHLYGAKVYVTVNTILFDQEIEDTRLLLHGLEQARVDAILVQDMAVLQIMHDEAIKVAVHASTQTDNRTVEKVQWLSDLGFRRVVLARESSLRDIENIHQKLPDTELEVFVHGALCVSYSGLCYASQYCFDRSANRGACAQFCRMKFDLVDANGVEWEHQRHLLSLKDMNQLSNLEALADAGATSFKIEGRLKDLSYVKNVTAAYSEALNQLVTRHPERYQRASKGRCTYTFRPDLNRTFNRGYTTYFLGDKRQPVWSPNTPKALGEYVGKVKELRGNSFNVASVAAFANGDGLCFINEQRELEGFRVNRAEGNRLYPLKMPRGLKPGSALYRSNDQQMERLLAKPSAERKIPVVMSLHATDSGFSLSMDEVVSFNENGHVLSKEEVVATIEAELQVAQKPQRENIVRQLEKLGGTPYECVEVRLPDDFNYFIPSSLLANLRRQAVTLLQQRSENTAAATPLKELPLLPPPPYKRSYSYNVSNSLSRSFYEQRGVKPEPAFELRQPADAQLMQCRHCIRFSMGYCVKHGGKRPEWKEPLRLRLSDGREFRLEFDCVQCQMNVYADA
ncbi:peptidase U32 family protein [Xylanibacter brevis]|uniref:peptidase U32 family protein n=1 Tax=Xylanibacter brevis TaxID=83231 RepID=UPI0004847230|nr:U32 family peptidase [Xylanibacter brevis]